MFEVYLALVLFFVDNMHRFLVNACIEAASARSSGEKYDAVERGLMAMDAKHYSKERADMIGLLYGNLLLQDMPRSTKLQICMRLAKIEGLHFSIEGLLQIANKLRKEVVEHPVDKNFYSFDLGRAKKDVEIVDELISALQAQGKTANSFSLRRTRLPGKPIEITPIDR